MEPTLEIQWTDHVNAFPPQKIKNLAKQVMVKWLPNLFTARTARASDLIAGCGKKPCFHLHHIKQMHWRRHLACESLRNWPTWKTPLGLDLGLWVFCWFLLCACVFVQYILRCNISCGHTFGRFFSTYVKCSIVNGPFKWLTLNKINKQNNIYLSTIGLRRTEENFVSFFFTELSFILHNRRSVVARSAPCFFYLKLWSSRRQNICFLPQSCPTPFPPVLCAHPIYSQYVICQDLRTDSSTLPPPPSPLPPVSEKSGGKTGGKRPLKLLLPISTR